MNSLSTVTRPQIYASTKFLNVRFSAISKRKRIQVQLLNDVQNLGSKGEIVSVRPSYMINVLHRNNGASYILPNQGPRIPVVEKQTQPTQLKTTKKESATEKKEDLIGSKEKITLDELTEITGLKFHKNESSKQ
ncbi:hypothetical protein PACTADRAFT_35398 [Pachysolen tannophilus NRRL Y-2460]|uniref:Ribosomal protein L9 domain-containing protein n=1 Tax=Pachysolen tannophilus NRRL Y-2460 TaxID=669874 RepID=A0A1E4TPG0_PACTA|nr:hypothetical protein PACTADRAFT_35398 [Pachysolen tannophilus NRRL Y-2460]